MAASIPNSYSPATAAVAFAPLGKEVVDPASGERSMRWLLRNNRAMTLMQMLLVYLVVSVVSLGIATVFWLNGATLVLPFAGAELLALGAAMWFYARHAGDSEDILLERDGLTVINTNGRRVDRVAFQPSWVRVEPEHGDGSLIELSGQGHKVAVGRFVRPERRRQLADEIRWALRRWHPGVALGAS